MRVQGRIPASPPHATPTSDGVNTTAVSFQPLRYFILITPTLHRSSALVPRWRGPFAFRYNIFNHHSSDDKYFGSLPLASQ
jgi:hypothetical protein